MPGKRFVSKVEIIGAIFGVALGAILHFTYVWSGNALIVGLFSAINESVWEHTKLLVTPLLVYAVVELYLFHNARRVLFAKVVEALFGILFMIGFFYTYTGAFGIESLAIDIASFAVAVAIGKYISYLIITSEKEPLLSPAVSVFIIAVMIAWFILVTIRPFHVPLFKDGPTGTYGIPKSG